MMTRLSILSAWLVASVVGGCYTRYREDLDYSFEVQQTWPLEDLNHGEIVQFESVFWEPDDTVSLRTLIVEDLIANGRDVLEIGTGTGLISILCLQNDATRVIATDINPAAVANAKYNAAILAPDGDFLVRQVSTDSPGAFAVIAADEKFDLIISNPPWEDGSIGKPADHAFYDPGFALMDSLLDGLPQHLNPGGRCLLAYGHVPAIERLRQESERRGYAFKILDDRPLDGLPKDFLPGMLVEIRPPLGKSIVSGGTFQDAAEVAPQRDPADADGDLKGADEGSPPDESQHETDGVNKGVVQSPPPNDLRGAESTAASSESAPTEDAAAESESGKD